MLTKSPSVEQIQIVVGKITANENVHFQINQCIDDEQDGRWLLNMIVKLYDFWLLQCGWKYVYKKKKQSLKKSMALRKHLAKD